MVSYNDLYADFVSDENIKLAIINSSRDKRTRPEIKEIYEHADYYIPEIRRYAMNFKNSEHVSKEIYDSITRKKRIIVVPEYKEQIVHHMCVNILKPIFTRGMYEHSYGSIPGRGPHAGKRTIERWIKHCKYINYDTMEYCLKMDIRKFFDNISQDILKKKLAKKIKDKYFLEVLYEIIGAIPSGLPLGYYTSQWFANWYLQDLDHYIKEDLRAEFYIRYMDDMVIFDKSKQRLHTFLGCIKSYLKHELGLELKDNYQIFRFHYLDENGNDCGRDLDFMGFRFYRNRTVLRQNIMYKATRKAAKISKKERRTVYDCRQMLSYLGWLSATNSYGMYQKWIKGKVNVRRMKKQIGNSDRAKLRLEEKTYGLENSRKHH